MPVRTKPADNRPRKAEADLLSIDSVDVFIGGRRVGTLAQPSPRSPVLFEYSKEWLSDGFSISPFSLPIEAGVKSPPSSLPGALFGIFSDSLPDDWGRLLADRKIAQVGIDPTSIGPIARLALVGCSGLGALEYKPQLSLESPWEDMSYDSLFQQCQHLLDNDETTALDTLYRHGGSSGGARPKAMLNIDGEPWIVKFPTTSDGTGSGAAEYRYAEAAKACGIAMPETRLIPSAHCAGFFAVKRFDRKRDSEGNIRKVHMASAAALLEADPFDEAIDYRDLMQLCLSLTADARDIDQLFRVMCFNVMADNCDDHIRNFSFLRDDSGLWRLSPAYDLTPNPGFFGEHSVLINGKGSGITDEDLVTIGSSGGMTRQRTREIIDLVRHTVATRLEANP